MWLSILERNKLEIKILKNDKKIKIKTIFSFLKIFFFKKDGFNGGRTSKEPIANNYNNNNNNNNKNKNCSAC